MTAATFLRLLKEDDKGSALAEEVRAARQGSPTERRFGVEPEAFRKVPTTPFAYWVSERIRDLFVTLPPFEGDGRTVKVGLQTSDDFRFVRAWWEVRASRILDGRNGPDWRADLESFQSWCRHRTHQKRWAPFAKGGEYSPFYADLHLVVNWGDEGAEIRSFVDPKTQRTYSRPQNIDFYFRPGLTWPLRASRFAPSALPAASIFSVRGYAILANHHDLPSLSGLGNSMAFDYVFKTLLGRFGFPEFVVGVLQRLPVPLSLPTHLGKLALEAIALERVKASWQEADHSLTLPPLLFFSGDTLADRLTATNSALSERHHRALEIQSEIDEMCFAALDFASEERRAALDESGATAEEGLATAAAEQQAEGVGERGEAGDRYEQDIVGRSHLVAGDLVSWCVGVMAGRFDIRLATRERPIPERGDPFDPLPVCSPAMLQGDDGLPLRNTPADYPVRVDEDGILLDEPGHSDDIVAGVREVLRVVFGDRADAIETEACGMLGVKRLREYFARTSANGFWREHISRYSKSPRVAPIYWLLQSPGGTTRFWLYLHRLDRDTLPKLLGSRYLGGLIEKTRQAIAELRPDGELLAGLSKADERRVAELDERLVDLGEMTARVRRVLERTNDRGEAVGWVPELDDGVVLNAAPLHELIPWPRKRKVGGRSVSELEAYWSELAEGRYDWSHTAMLYWPTRVAAACRTNKSFAIAHGRMDLYEEEEP